MKKIMVDCKTKNTLLSQLSNDRSNEAEEIIPFQITSNLSYSWLFKIGFANNNHGKFLRKWGTT